MNNANQGLNYDATDGEGGDGVDGGSRANGDDSDDWLTMMIIDRSRDSNVPCTSTFHVLTSDRGAFVLSRVVLCMAAYGCTAP